MEIKYKKYIVMSLIVAVVLPITACNKKDGVNNGSGSGVSSSDKTENTNFIRPDKNHPFSSYSNITSGKQLAFLYYALSATSPDYDKIANQNFIDYRETTDTFKKQEMLKVITQQIDSSINTAKTERYITFTTTVILDSPVNNSYNLWSTVDTRSSRRSNSFLSGDGNWTPDDGLSGYAVICINRDEFSKVPVPNESIKIIESQKASDNIFKVKVYGFAKSDWGNSGSVEMVVQRVEILSKDGNILATYDPR